MPTGKRCYQAFGRFVQALAEGEIVAAIAHVDADADGGLAIDAEHLGGRIAVAALDLGDVGQFVEAPVDPEVEVGDILRLEESAGDVDEHVLLRRVDDARGHYGVLLSDRRQYFVEVELEIGELLGREVQDRPSRPGRRRFRPCRHRAQRRNSARAVSAKSRAWRGVKPS